MAQPRLGQAIRGAIIGARPPPPASEVYPPVSPSPPSPPAKSDQAPPRATEAELIHAVQALREQVRWLGEAVDLVRRDHVAMTGELTAIKESFWRRFDELEIKTRPLIPFDDESWAVRLMDGYAMIPRAEPAFTVMVANAGSGGLEPGARRVLQALIEPGMVVADVGANVGLLTLACARACGPGGRVHAFEPEAGPRAQLAKTVRLNGLDWVEIHDCAVGAASGEARLHVSQVIGHSSLYPLPAAEAGGAQTVSVRALDDLFAGARLDVVKIDVEGAELDVLAGMARLTEQNPDLAVVAEFGPAHLARVGVSPDDWLAAFADRGFTAFAIEEPWGVCAPFRFEAALEWVNLALVRPGGAAERRLPRQRA
ncbi:MAG TPA: FkbM family methyltransferase [Caulobacteraceae bacterium]|nr:FkbM family methyltransferase [Caulobacteraceae bacterium]